MDQTLRTTAPLSSLSSISLSPLKIKKPVFCCYCLVSKSCPTFCDPMDCSLPDSSVHGILQARILEWVFISFSRLSSELKDVTCISCIGMQVLHHWAIREEHVLIFELKIIIMRTISSLLNITFCKISGKWCRSFSVYHVRRHMMSIYHCSAFHGSSLWSYNFPTVS